MKRLVLTLVVTSIGLASTAAIWLTVDTGRARNWACGLGVCPPVDHYQTIQSTIYDLGMGGLTSVLFYALLVALPERRKRRRYRDSLLRSYKDFKSECIGIILGAERGLIPMNLLDALQEQEEFRRYFKQPWSDDQSRWDHFCNSLEPHHLKSLSSSMAVFREELSITIHAIDVDDEQAFDLLKRLTHAMASNEETTLDYDEVKGFAGFLWSLFAGWSFIHGYSDHDKIEATIRSI